MVIEKEEFCPKCLSLGASEQEASSKWHYDFQRCSRCGYDRMITMSRRTKHSKTKLRYEVSFEVIGDGRVNTKELADKIRGALRTYLRDQNVPIESVRTVLTKKVTESEYK